MRVYFGFFLALLATASGFYLTWRFAQPEFNGHWHIVTSDTIWSNPGISTLDIHLNGAVIADEFAGEQNGIVGSVDRFHRHIYLGPSCLSLELDLSWQGDTLVFDETPWKGYDHEPEQFKAIHIPTGECTYERDFFLRFGRKFQLPKVSRNQASVLYDPQSISLFVTAGFDRPIIQAYFGRDIEWNELANEVDKMDIKAQAENKPVPVSIFADYNIPVDQIESILSFFEDENKGRLIYRIHRVIDSNGHSSFYSLEI